MQHKVAPEQTPRTDMRKVKHLRNYKRIRARKGYMAKRLLAVTECV